MIIKPLFDRVLITPVKGKKTCLIVPDSTQGEKMQVIALGENTNTVKPNDVVLVTCGDIQDDKNVCYIAVGDNEGIHVYKNSYGGSKKQIVNTISKCAVFYLVKKLKQNDLFFNKIYV